MLLFPTWLTFATSEAPESPVVLGKRHIIILKSDSKNLWGYYYFGIHNHSVIPQKANFSLRLPTETEQFRPGENLQNDDISLGNQGDLVITKEFPSGLNLHSISFQATLDPSGQTKMTIRPAADVDEISVATSFESQLSLTSTQLSPGVPHMLDSKMYKGLMTSNAKEGTDIIVSVLGTPKGRDPLWIITSLSFCFLIATCLIFARKFKVSSTC